MQKSDSELVLVCEELKQPEVDILVHNVDQDASDFEKRGGRIVVAPFDIAIGRCAVVHDPWDNEFVLLDASKGHLKADSNKNVVS
jgi:predicted enzyme related to lactoylglutathione lyase